MELWIRSFTKLIKVDRVEIVLNAQNHEIYANGFFVGTYASGKRALEVLDEIQKALDDEYDFYIYKMPEE